MPSYVVVRWPPDAQTDSEHEAERMEIGRTTTAVWNQVRQKGSFICTGCIYINIAMAMPINKRTVCSSGYLATIHSCPATFFILLDFP